MLPTEAAEVAEVAEAAVATIGDATATVTATTDEDAAEDVGAATEDANKKARAAQLSNIAKTASAPSGTNPPITPSWRKTPPTAGPGDRQRRIPCASLFYQEGRMAAFSSSWA